MAKSDSWSWSAYASIGFFKTTQRHDNMNADQDANFRRSNLQIKKKLSLN